MAELYLKGYLCNDDDDIIALNEKTAEECSDYWERCGKSIIESIETFAKDYGFLKEHNEGLGGTKTYIEDCNLRAYFTDKKCDLEETMLAMDMMMYGGDIKTIVNLTGYSEYTITGMYLEKFTIGGHDLTREFNSHIGQYCHLIIECQ